MALSSSSTSSVVRKSRVDVIISWVMSLAFWLALLFAAAVYGVVVLSPRWFAHSELKQKHSVNQTKLVQLESNVNQLQRVVTALEQDPQFVRELARTEFDVSRFGEERISVEPSLALEATAAEPLELMHSANFFSAPVLQTFAENGPIRRYLLILAAGTVLFAFVFLHESQLPLLIRFVLVIWCFFRGIGRGASCFFRRYQKSVEHGAE